MERVSSRLFHHGAHAVEDFATARIDLAGGAALQLACSWNLSAGCDCIISVAFHGTRGGAALRNVGGSFYDFVAEQYQKTQTIRLAEPPDAWGGRAAVAFARQLAESNRFDPSIERIVDVATVLDDIYAGGRA